MTTRKRLEKNLSGKWSFCLDPNDRGLAEKWYGSGKNFKDIIQVPGAWQAQGFGDDQYCTPLCQSKGIPPMVIEKKSYFGTGWYRKEIFIPEEWRDMIIRLSFGGTHPLAEIWVDDNFVAIHKGSFLEHSHDITSYVDPGHRHILTVRISEYPNTGSRLMNTVEGGTFNIITWSGIYRNVMLEAKESSYIERVLITPDIKNKQAEFNVRLSGEPGNAMKLKVNIFGPDGKTAGALETALDSGQCFSMIKFAVPISGVMLWTPETPYLYRTEITLLDQTDRTVDETSERFGMREFAVDGQQILLNGHSVFLRGYGDDQLYVHTLSPYLEPEMLKKDIKQARAYGFNYVDFLYSVPHREYLEMADEMGIIIQCYPIQLTDSGDQSYAKKEYIEKVIGQLYNHPSVAIYSVVAERYGHDPIVRQKIEHLRQMTADIDSTRLFATTGGIDRSDAERDKTDILEMAGGFTCMPEKLDVCRKPVVLHEYRWWSSYPDSALKEKYNKSALRPFFIEYAEQVAQEKGMSDLLPIFVKNSQKMQALERKIGIERARRNPGIKGYAIWLGKDLKEAVEGIWDDFGDPKNVSAKEFCQSNAETVLLIDKDYLYRCYWTFEDIPIEMWLSHYGREPISGGKIFWRLETADNAELLDKGLISDISFPTGAADRVGRFRIKPERVEKPLRAVLKAELKAGKIYSVNHWDFWLFPTPDKKFSSNLNLQGDFQPNPDGKNKQLKIINRIDDSFFEHLADGGRIILMASGIFKERYSSFKSIGWNSSTEGCSGTVVKDHPALGNFPHERFCDLQFYSMLKTTPVIDLDIWPVKIEPIIRAISSYKTCCNLGHLFEVKAGGGRILITTFNFSLVWESYPTSDIEIQYLMRQLQNYAEGDLFNPEVEVPLSFFEKHRNKVSPEKP